MTRATASFTLVWLLALGCGDDGEGGPADAGAGDAGMLPGDGGGDPSDAGGDPDSSVDACGGSCVHGTCNAATSICECETGWDGETCEEPVLPSSEGLLLWLDATDVDTLTFEGANATAWQDKGPEAQVFAPAAASNGPTLSSIGTRPALAFDGVDDYLATSGFDGLTGELRYTMFLVVSAGTDNQVLVGFDGEDERIRLRDTPLGMTYTHRVPAGASHTVSGLDAYARDQVHVITIQRTNEETSIWIDGGTRIVFPAANPEALVGSLDLTLGEDLETGDGEPLDGKLGEVLIFDSNLDFASRERVETYLAAKWLDAEPHHDASSLGNLALWLDAAHEGSFTLSGDAVTRWTSRVRGHVFANVTTEQQPTRVAAGLGGNPVVRFDGADDGLFATNLNLLNGIQRYTIAVVIDSDGSDNGAVLYGADVADVTLPSLLVQAETGPERLRITHRGTPAHSGGDVVAISDGIVDTALRAIAQRDATTMVLEGLWSDGTTESDSDEVAEDPLAALTYVVGAKRPNHSIDNFAGDIAEILVFQRRLSTAELEYLREMLDAKWGF